MKKILLSLVLIAFTLGTPTAKAIDFDWGVTGGLNVTKLNMNGTGEKFFSSSNRAGWFIGPKIDLGFALGFGLDASVLFQQTQHNLKLETPLGDLSATHSSNFISLPINARYNIGIGDSFSIYVATGPQFDFGWGDTEEKWFSTTFRRENLAINWNVGAGVRVLKHLELGLSYNFGWTKAGERVDDWKESILNSLNGNKEDYRANTFKLQATYYF